MTSLPVSLNSMTVTDLLAAISSNEPAPGAGAAGAVALALGLACARKAIRITGQHHPSDRLLLAVEARLAALSEDTLELGRQDAECFAELMAAMQLPHDCAHEVEARDRAMKQSNQALRANTANLIATCDEAQAKLHSITDHVTDAMAGDVAAARALIGAARAIHAANLAESDSAGT